MKCVKSKESGNIERVNDRMAHDRVNSGEWVYCPKHEYKAVVKLPVKEDNSEYKKDMQASYNKYL